jgi:outer membrane protein OmpA-like peptidoglycan-associated protein
LQRKCACGGTPGRADKCEACRKKKLQSRLGNPSAPSSNNDLLSSIPGVPPIVHEVLRSPGQPLDPATRAFFEPRFGHDFGNVRVHTDARAAESAQAVNALAFTVGSDIAFSSGQYSPHLSPGKQLLAHELAHVIQQSAARPDLSKLHIGEPSDNFERAADALTHQIMHGEPATTRASIKTVSSAAVLQRQPVAGSDDPSLEVGTGSPLEASFAGSMTLDKFDFNKSELTEEHTAALKDHAKRVNQLLRHYRDSFISITGHTDAIGEEKSNQELGQKRADAVLAELTKNGVPADILRAGSLGETAPAVAGKTAEPRNRRVEIFFRARNFNRALLGGELQLGAQSPASLPGFFKELKPPPTKKIDLSLPTPSAFPGPFDPSLGISPPERKKTSVSKLVDDKVDAAINPLIKRLPNWIQERIRSGAHSLIEKGVSSLLDEALKNSPLDATGKEAVRKAVEAIGTIEFNLP